MGSSYWLVLSQEFGNITAKLIRKLIRIVECVNDLPLTLSLKEREFPFSFKEKGSGVEVNSTGEGVRG
jgi:hypothetical protein